MSVYTLQSTVSSQPLRQICTHFRLFCSPPPRQSRVFGYSWRSQLRLLIEPIRFGEARYLLPVPTGSLLFVLLASTRMFRARGTLSLLLHNGWFGCCPPQAWHRDGKGTCPLPSGWCYKESTSSHDENKVIVTETPNITISWTRMTGHCCTMMSLKRVHIFMYLQEKTE